MNKIVLIGASGHGEVCAEIAELQERYDEVLFLDDNSALTRCGRYTVYGTTDDIEKFIGYDTDFFVSIGNQIQRRHLQERIENLGGNIVTLIHPAAVISVSATIGRGSVIMPGAVVNAGTIIGKGVIINTSSSVDHDCDIDDYSHISVGAHVCGTVTIGSGSWIGAGATVVNNISVTNNCCIGAGAVVIHDLIESGTYIGIPAKRMR